MGGKIPHFSFGGGTKPDFYWRVNEFPCRKGSVAKLFRLFRQRVFDGPMPWLSEIKTILGTDPKMREVVDIAARWKGTVRIAGTHAAGV